MAQDQGNAAAVLKLALRLLTGPRLFQVDTSDSGTWEPRVFLHQMPTGLPVDLPVPSGTQILGGREVKGRGSYWARIVLDTVLSREGALDSYGKELLAQGWGTVENGACEESSTVRREPAAVFFHSTSATMLHAAVMNSAGAVQLVLDVHSRTVGGVRQDGLIGRHLEILPDLHAPNGAHHILLHRHSSRSQAQKIATVATTSDAQALHEHYAAQLKEIGWTLKGLGHGGPVVGSTWSFRDADDRDWRGTLCILQMAESPQQYCLDLQADADRQRDTSESRRWK